MESGKMNGLNRVFTRNMLSHLIDGKKDNAYASIVKRYIVEPEKKKNRELISEIYMQLGDNYRNEYFYKNTLLNKLLLGVHSVNTTTAFTELPIAKSKADFLLINGKAVVYEIKTELDNLERLASQIDDYYKAFDHVTVVTYEKNIQQLQLILEDIKRPIGIIVLKKKGNLSVIKKPERYTEGLDREVIFKILRKSEYEQILLQKYGKLPEVTQFKYYSACKELFMNIPLDESYLMVLKQLKKRMVIENKEFVNVPYELKFLAYFMELKEREYHQLQVILEQEYGGL